MGCAPMAHLLFSRFMNYNPKNPTWVKQTCATYTKEVIRSCGLFPVTNCELAFFLLNLSSRLTVIASFCPTDTPALSSTSCFT